ncbi:hypothetical protein QVZ41_14435 [Wenyingzhuangia sp. chi5]|uniref:Uncharacterized protein n=1 Tax=Wenyingzhuangia gilva TaxID=3057677 RepID=A0ABT8VVU5_9FLAO|nr:hypothetical protein [Wenyingzhuangia sp. chi5]MDO3696047.1 hypothetical protein [Wenyingzhuangia sp. chi5]
MTLIVSRIDKNKIKIISDSKITDKDAVRNNPLLGNLKSFILNPQISVSFAGNVHYAEKFLTLFFSNQIQTLEELKLCCLSLNNESNNETDFLIASLIEKPNLCKVSNRKISENLQNVWIGDKLGFEKYQTSLHGDNTEKKIFAKMSDAFEKVIADETIESISDFQIAINTVYHQETDSDFFIYEMRMNMSFAPQTITVKKNEPVSIPFGGPEIGGFGSSYLRSIDFLRPAIAIHFPQGKFGILFCPLLNFNKGIIEKIEDGEDFAKLIKEKYGIPLEGIVASNGSRMKRIVIK